MYGEPKGKDSFYRGVDVKPFQGSLESRVVLKEERLCDFHVKSCVLRAILDIDGAQSLPGPCRIELSR